MPRRIHLTERLGESCCRPAHRRRQFPSVVVDHDLADCDSGENGVGFTDEAGVGDRDLDPLPADLSLELVRGAMSDLSPVVDDDDVVGEVVGLLEILGSQQQGRSPLHEVPDHHPEVDPAARVETGRGLVEEEHRRRCHQGAGHVEAAPHAPGVGLHRPVAGVG